MTETTIDRIEEISRNDQKSSKWRQILVAGSGKRINKSAIR